MDSYKINLIISNKDINQKLTKITNQYLNKIIKQKITKIINQYLTKIIQIM